MGCLLLHTTLYPHFGIPSAVRPHHPFPLSFQGLRCHARWHMHRAPQRSGAPMDLAMELRKDHHDGIWHTTTPASGTVAQAVPRGIGGLRGGGIGLGGAMGCGGGRAGRNIGHGQIRGLFPLYTQRFHLLDWPDRVRFGRRTILLHRANQTHEPAGQRGLATARFAAKPANRGTAAQIPACAQQRLHTDGARDHRA